MYGVKQILLVILKVWPVIDGWQAIILTPACQSSFTWLVSVIYFLQKDSASLCLH